MFALSEQRSTQSCLRSTGRPKDTSVSRQVSHLKTRHEDNEEGTHFHLAELPYKSCGKISRERAVLDTVLPAQKRLTRFPSNGERNFRRKYLNFFTVGYGTDQKWKTLDLRLWASALVGWVR